MKFSYAAIVFVACAIGCGGPPDGPAPDRPSNITRELVNRLQWGLHFALA